MLNHVQCRHRAEFWPGSLRVLRPWKIQRGWCRVFGVLLQQCHQRPISRPLCVGWSPMPDLLVWYRARARWDIMFAMPDWNICSGSC